MFTGEVVIAKKKALFFTDNTSIKKLFMFALFLPGAASGVMGQVLGSKLFKTSGLEGKLWLTNQGFKFETGNLDKFLGIGNLDFEIPFKEIKNISTGKKLWKKTIVLNVGDSSLEFSIFGVDGFLKKIREKISSEIVSINNRGY